MLRKKTQEHDIFIIDCSQKMLQQVKDTTLSIIQGDVTSFPLKSKTFTLAIMINTLHHITKDTQSLALREICRILKQHGRLFIIDIYFPNTLLSTLFVNIEQLLVGDTSHLDPPAMKRVVEDAGFQEVEIFYYEKNQYRYGALAAK